MKQIFLYIQSDSRKLEANDIFCLYENFAENSQEYLAVKLAKKLKTVLIKKNSPYLKDANKFENILISNEDQCKFMDTLPPFKR